MPIPIEKDVSWFKLRQQARKKDNENDLGQLGESLIVRQLQPVGCLGDGTVIWGNRRVLAARMVGLKTLLALVFAEPIEETQFRLLQATENFHRLDLSQVEKSKVCEELRSLNPGWEAQDIAQHLKVSAPTVTQLLSPGRCIPSIRKAFEDGVLTLDEVYTISQLPKEQQQEALDLKLGGANRAAIRGHVAKRKKGPAPDVRLSRVSCPLPTEHSVTISGPDLNLDHVIDDLVDVLREARKARGQMLDVKTFVAVMKDKAKGGQ